MEIIVGKTAGFCFGVSNAIKKTNELLDKGKKIYCLGELVHNKQVTEELKNKGLNIIDNINDAGEEVIIRSHGVKKEIYKLLKDKKSNIVDLTCPKVLRIHKIADEYSQNGYYIFLIGKHEHPEIIGTISYCGNNVDVIEKEEDVNEKLTKFYNSNINKLLILSQTTFNLEKFNHIISIIKNAIEKIDKNIQLEIKNTICDATRLRQEETVKISKEVDLMIIIGGKHSSNTNKLYEISKKYCNNCILIETKKEIRIEEVKRYKKIGIMAGASTPRKSIDSVVEMLNTIC